MSIAGKRKMMTHAVQTREHHPATRPAVAGANRAIAFRIAQRIDEVESSLRLVYAAYRQRGLIAANLSELRITPYHLLPTTEVLIATRGKRVVCTATLVHDNPRLGLPMESMYADEVSQRRAFGLRLAEASCLADDPDEKPPLHALVRLMALTIQCAYRRGVAELLAAMHPHHADFYTGFLGFEAFGEVRSCPAVRDHPAVALALDLKRLRDRHPRAHCRAFDPPFDDATLRPRPLSSEVRDYLTFRLQGAMPPAQYGGHETARAAVCV
jgi:hypothetical protein